MFNIKIAVALFTARALLKSASVVPPGGVAWHGGIVAPAVQFQQLPYVPLGNRSIRGFREPRALVNEG
jgi:hypothetical protein